MKLLKLFVVTFATLITPSLTVQNSPPNQCRITIGPETFSKSILFVGPPGKRGPTGPPGPPGTQGSLCNCQNLKPEIAKLEKVINKNLEELREANKRLRERLNEIEQKKEVIQKRNPTLPLTSRAKDCSEIPLENGDGVNYIYPTPFTTVRAMCDMTTVPGGWTVIQRRIDGSVDFNRNWHDYKNGFGSPSGEYWIGLEVIHLLTKHGNYSLRIELEDRKGKSGHATYETFFVTDEDSNFKLNIIGYSGNLGNSLSYNHKMMFSTKDKDNDMDTWSAASCAVNNKGGWWYKSCTNTNLNGDYEVVTGRSGLTWFHWSYNWDTMRSSKMMIKPKA